MCTSLAPFGAPLHPVRRLDRPRLALLPLTLASLWAAPLAAQDSSPATWPDPGTRVRIVTAPPSASVVSGQLVSAEGGVLSVSEDGGEGVIEVPMSLVERLEVSRGHSRNTLRGLALGAAIGAVPGLLFGIAVRGGDDNPLDNYSPVVTAAAGAVALGTIGGLVGVAIGSTSKSERWTRLELAVHSRAELREASGLGLRSAPGVGVSFRLAF